MPALRHNLGLVGCEVYVQPADPNHSNRHNNSRYTLSLSSEERADGCYLSGA